jgi:pantothenate kinase-related protein Tda10
MRCDHGRKKIPEYDLEQGLLYLAEKVRKAMDKREPVVVGVVGGYSSGKTEALAKKLLNIFGPDAVIYTMDDYYRGI